MSRGKDRAVQKVTIETRTVGQSFATVAVIRAVGGRRRKIAETETLRPYGFDHAARLDGEALATAHGWQIVDR